MSALSLRVDSNRWREQLKAYTGQHPEVVPVTKGNGYGFGSGVLAAEAAALGVGTLAVGTYDELPAVAHVFPGEVLVLSPWRSNADLGSERVVHTVSRLVDLQTLAASGQRPQVVVEVLTSIRRHGISLDELENAKQLLDRVRFRGWALHLPLAGDRLSEARRLAAHLVEAGHQHHHPLWVSHLEPIDATNLAAELSLDVRLRVGTALWLGARDALQARASVLDVHSLQRGDRYGYRQRRSQRRNNLAVVSGGTAHGIALEGPTAAATMRQRVVALVRGSLEASGRALSPYSFAGRRCWFAEPPHMQCSMIWLPRGVEPPAVGDEVDVDVRFTTTSFDRIIWA